MVPWLDVALRVVVLFGLIVSWIGTIVPVFPAPTVMWLLTLVYGIASGFETRGAMFFGIITVLTVVSWFTDEFLGIVGARKGGARWPSVALASVVGLVTSLLLTPLVGILLTVASLFAIESYHRKNAEEAWQVTKSMLVGWGWAVAARLAIGLTTIVLWAIWAW